MKNSLSVLIPVYNYDCTALVEELCSQIVPLAAEGVEAEIIVAEDGSSNQLTLRSNAKIAEAPFCRYIVRPRNAGRSAIRNFLAQSSRHEWLLFLDCDMSIISSQFLRNYLNQEGDVVYGGYHIRQDSAPRSCLRYIYELQSLPLQTTEQRRKQPYHNFHTSNFMVRREVMLAHPFDEEFRQYGYEDVLFGKQLREAGIEINHQEIPVGFLEFESNESFVSKTEEGLRTLHEHRKQLRGYSRLLTVVDGIHLGIVRWTIRAFHRLCGPLERRNLCGSHPRLDVFKLYKLGYYLTLTKNDK